MADKRIAISEENRERLKDRKRGDDTYDDVLDRVLGDGDFVSEAEVQISPELDEARVDEMIDELEARLSDVDTAVTSEDVVNDIKEIIRDEYSGVSYDDTVAACRAAIRDELPDGAFR